MSCPLCQRRPAKRRCPALGDLICPTCCATKRLREIACPDTCVHLRAAKAHPPAVVQRQRERDVSLLLRLFEGLPPAQLDLAAALHLEVAAYRRTAVPPIQDVDLADAAAALASTFETAARGILYEHQTASLPAQRLAQLLRDAIQRLEARRPIPAGQVAMVCRRIEEGARRGGETVGSGPASYLDFLDRTNPDLPQRGAAEGEEGRAPPRIILP